MADVPFSEFGKGSIFRLRSRIAGTIASGVTGNILTLTAPAGQVARLTSLFASAVTTQAGISVISDGNTVLSGVLGENDSSPSGNFLVSESFLLSTSAPASDGSIIVKQVVGNSVVINKNAGNTTEAINYAVEYGVIQ